MCLCISAHPWNKFHLNKWNLKMFCIFFFFYPCAGLALFCFKRTESSLTDNIYVFGFNFVFITHYVFCFNFLLFLLFDNKFLQKKYIFNIFSIITLQSLLDTTICSCIQFFFTCVAPSSLDKHWIELLNQILLHIFQHIVDERYVN